MRYVYLGYLALLGCGGGGGGGGGSAPAPTTESSSNVISFLADSADELPDCDDSLDGALGYAEDDGLFYGCDGSSWAAVGGAANEREIVRVRAASASECASGGKAILVGVDTDNNGELATAEVSTTTPVCAAPDQEPEFEVTATYVATGNGTNLCTKNAPDDNCYLVAATLNEHANGAWTLRFQFRHTFDDGAGDTDQQDKDVTFLVPTGNSDGGVTVLSNHVERTGLAGTTLWAGVAAGKTQVYLKHDTDNDGVMENSDSTVQTVTLTAQ